MTTKTTKGEFGYIKNSRKNAIIRTVVAFSLTLIVFFLGLILYHSQKNIFSIIAALLCLPTGWFAVNMIMFLKAKGCSDEDHSKIAAHAGALLMNYDLIITAYDHNFNVNAITVLDKNIIGYSADEKLEPADCEKHILRMVSQSGYSNYSIKIFDNIDRFCERLDGLEKLRQEKNIDPQAIEDSWEAGTVQTPTGVLLSISL